jgi:hypothetical protein
MNTACCLDSWFCSRAASFQEQSRLTEGLLLRRLTNCHCRCSCRRRRACDACDGLGTRLRTIAITYRIKTSQVPLQVNETHRFFCEFEAFDGQCRRQRLLGFWQQNNRLPFRLHTRMSEFGQDKTPRSSGVQSSDRKCGSFECSCGRRATGLR